MWGIYLDKQKTVSEIAKILEQDTLPNSVIKDLKKDSRISVLKLLNKWNLRKEQQEISVARLKQLYVFEQQYYEAGYDYIAGIDEAGRGPLAGPLVIGAVILPHNIAIHRLNDSKRLSDKQRQSIYKEIKSVALAVEFIVVDIETIDQINIYQATIQGMYQIIKNLMVKPQAVLVDAVPLPKLSVPHRSIIGGDGLSASIAAASIIAKVERDRIMTELDMQYPKYGFAKHKGYGTKEHLEAITKYGPCPIHRKSFHPVKQFHLSNKEYTLF